MTGTPRQFNVTFERIGRNHHVPPLSVETGRSGASTDVAAAVHAHARRYLNSAGYAVAVDLDSGVVSIEGGRFGRGAVAEVSP